MTTMSLRWEHPNMGPMESTNGCQSHGKDPFPLRHSCKFYFPSSWFQSLSLFVVYSFALTSLKCWSKQGHLFDLRFQSGWFYLFIFFLQKLLVWLKTIKGFFFKFWLHTIKQSRESPSGLIFKQNLMKKKEAVYWKSFWNIPEDNM